MNVAYIGNLKVRGDIEMSVFPHRLGPILNIKSLSVTELNRME